MSITSEHIKWDDERIGKPIPPAPTSAWMDPLGKFFLVPDCGHMRWAEENFGTWNLEAKGWLHLSFGNILRDGIPRQCQLDALFDVLEVYETSDYEYAAKFRRSVYDIMDAIDRAQSI